MTLLRRPMLYGLGLTGLWLALAWANPSTTYHLAPLLVAGTTPASAALLLERPGAATVVAGAIVGTALSAAATLALTLADKLDGPSLLPFGGAVTEAVVFTGLGAAGGVAIGWMIAARS